MRSPIAISWMFVFALSAASAISSGCGLSPAGQSGDDKAGDGNDIQVSGQFENTLSPLGSLQGAFFSASVPQSLADDYNTCPGLTEITLSDLPLCEGFAPQRPYALVTLNLGHLVAGTLPASRSTPIPKSFDYAYGSQRILAQVDAGTYTVVDPDQTAKDQYPERFALLSAIVYQDPRNCGYARCNGQDFRGRLGSIKLEDSAILTQSPTVGSIENLHFDGPLLRTVPQQAAFRASACFVDLKPEPSGFQPIGNF